MACRYYTLKRDLGSEILEKLRFFSGSKGILIFSLFVWETLYASMGQTMLIAGRAKSLIPLRDGWFLPVLSNKSKIYNGLEI